MFCSPTFSCSIAIDYLSIANKTHPLLSPIMCKTYITVCYGDKNSIKYCHGSKGLGKAYLSSLSGVPEP
jgi:hypothetical protein